MGKKKALQNELTGYLHPDYARSFSEFGDPYFLPHCGGWILERPIAGFSCVDGMWPYPFFFCRDWGRLLRDVESLREELVTLSLVTDPFGDFHEAELKKCFPDRFMLFKRHYVVDLNLPLEAYVARHHRRYARKSLREVRIEQVPCASALLDEWLALYANLIVRHQIRGMLAFSRTAFALQLSLPGTLVFRALHQDETVGMTIWYVQGAVGYYHLGAYSDSGYALRASFAMFWQVLEYFRQHASVRWLNLGSHAGLSEADGDGLNRFKRGWSTGTRPVYFCGRIFDHAKYEQIVAARHVPPTTFFPAYRLGEFGSK